MRNTSFLNRGLNRGWARVTSRTEFVARFGQTFQDVDLNRRGFEGFKHYGNKEIPWLGSPICLLNWHALPVNLGHDDNLKQWIRMPSIVFYEQKQSEMEQRKWTIEELFDRIDEELKAWEARSEFERRHVSVLFCNLDGSLGTYTSEVASGSPI